MIKAILICDKCGAKDERELKLEGLYRVTLELDEEVSGVSGHKIFETNYAGYKKRMLLCGSCRGKVRELIGESVNAEVEMVKNFLENKEE